MRGDVAAAPENPKNMAPPPNRKRRHQPRRAGTMMGKHAADLASEGAGRRSQQKRAIARATEATAQAAELPNTRTATRTPKIHRMIEGSSAITVNM